MLYDGSVCPHCNRTVREDWWHDADCPALKEEATGQQPLSAGKREP